MLTHCDVLSNMKAQQYSAGTGGWRSIVEPGMATEEEIRALAYSIWESEGRPDGKEVEHYMRARQMLEAQAAGPDSSQETNPPEPGGGTESASKAAKRRTVKRRPRKS